MMLRALAWLFALTVACGLARADVTITNLDPNGNQVLPFDTNGNQAQIHTPYVFPSPASGGSCSGTFSPGACIYYIYTDDYSCGFLAGTPSSWCGFHVYSTTDFYYFTDLGKLFDPTTSAYQTICGYGGSVGGCYGLVAMHNAANNNFVFWFNSQATSPSKEYVITCTLPYSTPQTTGTNCSSATAATHLGQTVWDGAFPMVVGSTAYLLYDHGNTLELYIDQLNSAFTDGDGVHSIDTGNAGEQAGLFAANGVYYMGWDFPPCAYCNTSDADLAFASTPLGTYGTPTRIITGGCNGQWSGVFPVPAPNNTTFYLAMSNLFLNGLPNQSLSGQFFGLETFSGTTPQTVTCGTTTTLPGLTLSSAPPALPGLDQTSFANDSYSLDGCDINGDIWLLQTFTPTKTPLASVSIPVAQNNGVCSISSPCSPTTIAGDLTVSLVSLDGSNNPVSTLATGTVKAAAALWSPTQVVIPFSYPVSPGTPYGIELSAPTIASDGTQGCYAVIAWQGGSPSKYPSGVMRKSTNSGSTWTTQTNDTLMFSTFTQLTNSTAPPAWFRMRGEVKPPNPANDNLKSLFAAYGKG